MITLSHYLVLSAILFVIGVTGVLMRRNVILILLSIEIMLTAVNLNFIAFSHYMKNPVGQVFVFFVMTVAAAETALGLAIVIALFRNLGTVNVDEINQMKG
jgi:NADH-quinone oxidoreductase subunit K